MPLFQNLFTSSGVGDFSGRTMRKPRNCASVRYQMLLGSCGSCCFHDLSEARRAELRRRSTESSQERIERLRGLGAGFVHKPFRPEELVQAVGELTGGVV